MIQTVPVSFPALFKAFDPLIIPGWLNALPGYTYF
jgi:hypothetical protein